MLLSDSMVICGLAKMYKAVLHWTYLAMKGMSICEPRIVCILFSFLHIINNCANLCPNVKHWKKTWKEHQPTSPVVSKMDYACGRVIVLMILQLYPSRFKGPICAAIWVSELCQICGGDRPVIPTPEFVVDFWYFASFWNVFELRLKRETKFGKIKAWRSVKCLCQYFKLNLQFDLRNLYCTVLL